MKRVLAWALVALAGGCAGVRPVTAGGRAQVCLASYMIDHTDIPDDSTILFTMRDHTVYRNHLDHPCFGLRLDTRGFTYEPTDPGSDTICSNLVLIRTNTDHLTCALGEFVKVGGPPRP